MRTGKKWKIENGRISFSFGYIVCYAVFNLFQQLSISTLFFLNVQLKKLAKFLQVNKFSMNWLGGTTSSASVNQNSKYQLEEKDPFLLGSCATLFS